ncbi:MAG: hypothetical protein FWD31_06070 [Planctomycetaceae bacterium]|nr:hypothetical protein [Planctomycetaceae bacterium]
MEFFRGLWGLRSVAKNAKRIDDLIGYLLRKKRQLTNYAERHARGEWIASTRVEMLFGRSTGDGTTSPFHTENSATMQTSRNELDTIRSPRHRYIRQIYQTKITRHPKFHTSS